MVPPPRSLDQCQKESRHPPLATDAPHYIVVPMPPHQIHDPLSLGTVFSVPPESSLSMPLFSDFQQSSLPLPSSPVLSFQP